MRITHALKRERSEDSLALDRNRVAARKFLQYAQFAIHLVFLDLVFDRAQPGAAVINGAGEHVVHLAILGVALVHHPIDGVVVGVFPTVDHLEIALFGFRHFVSR